MWTFRRGLLIALSVATLFLLFRHNSPSTPSFRVNGLQQGLDTRPVTALSSASSNAQAGTLRTQPGVASSRPKTDPSLANKPLRQQLAYTFPYVPEDKFPAYIWQTWRTTPASGQFPGEWRGLEASWTDLHPGFVHEVITDSAAVHVLRHLYSGVPDVIAAYTALPMAVLKADFFRYLILLARGGIYSDIDTQALQSAVDWVPAHVPRSEFGLVIGIEADPDRPDWEQWYSRRIQFCQWTIQAKPGHPVLREIVASITEETLRRHDAGVLTRSAIGDGIVEFTGPAVWTDIIFNFFNDPKYFGPGDHLGNITWEIFTGMREAKKVGDVVVLPITCFSPGVQQMGAGEPDDPMAFVKHNFEGSWKPESERHIGEEQH